METLHFDYALMRHRMAQSFLGLHLVGSFACRVGFFAAGFTIFGEPKDQASRLTPNEVMNSVIGKKVAAGLHVAATFLLGEVLDTTHR